MPLHEQYLEAFKSAHWMFQAAIATILLLSFLLILPGLVPDRARRRKRCPKCWFSLEKHEFDEHHSITCPECGRVITKQKQLHRSKRSRRGIPIGGIVILAAIATPKANQDGLLSAIPMPIIARLPFSDDAPLAWARYIIGERYEDHWLSTEIIRRMDADEMSEWSYESWISRVERTLEDQGRLGPSPESVAALLSLNSTPVELTEGDLETPESHAAAISRATGIPLTVVRTEPRRTFRGWERTEVVGAETLRMSYISSQYHMCDGALTVYADDLKIPSPDCSVMIIDLKPRAEKLLREHNLEITPERLEKTYEHYYIYRAGLSQIHVYGPLTGRKSFCGPGPRYARRWVIAVGDERCTAFELNLIDVAFANANDKHGLGIRVPN